MNASPPTIVKIYISVIVLCAVALLFWLFSFVEINAETIKAGIFFSVLAIFADSMPVQLPRGGRVTVTEAVAFASIVLFGPLVSVLVMLLANIASESISKSKIHRLAFNCAQFVLATGTAGLVYQLLEGSGYNNSFENVFPYIVATFIYLAVNCTAFSLIMSLEFKISLYGIWLTNMRWAIPNLIMLAPLRLLMATTYTYTGPLGVILFFAPLLLARYIFKSYMDTREVYINTLEALADALDAKDRYTRGHSDRVANYAVELARRLKLREDEVEAVHHMAFLHDIGKIGISDELLTRVGRLADSEFDLIKMHPVIGEHILKELTYLGSFTHFVRSHHEKYDGTGYPDGLKGKAIPLGARIITLADSFDAMTSDRAYRTKMTSEEALEEVRRCSGTHFDPELVEVFLDLRSGKPAEEACGTFFATASVVEK
ncbi:HD-GYP domain-containing protein [Phosphitispora sp. TUW77]|uniref:HD-GYP domain-containing protein n=1 Tax=Phosphitispora sp. TUW77 TaxID=3152361 RepID=UPI003AB409ED